MRQKRQRIFAVLTALMLILAGCAAKQPEPSPAQTQTPPPIEADGWYEMSEEETDVTVYLSAEQGDWTAQTAADATFTAMQTESAQPGYTAFLVTPAYDCGQSTLTFSCAQNGAAVCACSMELFVNEAFTLEVVSSDLQQRANAAEEAGDTAVETPIDYTLDYHRYPALLPELFGAQLVTDAQRVIGAFLNGETAVEITPDCMEGLYVNRLGYALELMCPPFGALTDFDTFRAYADGELHWGYPSGFDAVRGQLTAFETAVCTIMQGIDSRDCETAAALELYHALTLDALYDYEYFDKKEVTAEEARLPNAAFNAIMNHIGVCGAYAGALSFLYTQIGIESIPVNGNAPDAFHAWTLASIGGAWVYCDPTYDLGGGFRYFGLSLADRCGWAGGFDADTVAACGVAVAETYRADSTRFSDLHDALTNGYADFSLDHKTQIASFAGGVYTLACDG